MMKYMYLISGAVSDISEGIEKRYSIYRIYIYQPKVKKSENILSSNGFVN